MVGARERAAAYAHGDRVGRIMPSAQLLPTAGHVVCLVHRRVDRVSSRGGRRLDGGVRPEVGSLFVGAECSLHVLSRGVTLEIVRSDVDGTDRRLFDGEA
jgi:hypothetical protein